MELEITPYNNPPIKFRRTKQYSTSRQRPKSALYLRLKRREVFKIVKGGPFGLFETPVLWKIRKKLNFFGEKVSKNLKMRFLKKCHSAEKCTRGTFWHFFASILLQNIETNEGDTLWCNPKNFKKSRIVPKQSGAKVGSLVCFRGSGCRFCFFFSFWTRF